MRPIMVIWGYHTFVVALADSRAVESETNSRFRPEIQNILASKGPESERPQIRREVTKSICTPLVPGDQTREELSVRTPSRSDGKTERDSRSKTSVTSSDVRVSWNEERKARAKNSGWAQDTDSEGSSRRKFQHEYQFCGAWKSEAFKEFSENLFSMWGKFRVVAGPVNVTDFRRGATAKVSASLLQPSVRLISRVSRHVGFSIAPRNEVKRDIQKKCLVITGLPSVWLCTARINMSPRWDTTQRRREWESVALVLRLNPSKRLNGSVPSYHTQFGQTGRP
ncbi:hypothetical protein C8J57DRAFT_1242574 [Mycena rebaudengoi]|nr:hypothetical protein C8J57DRAFT_1242574 [Mycena rebaudengoi]